MNEDTGQIYMNMGCSYKTSVQEQLALALNRTKRGEKAERVLLNLIARRGPSSETYGILGRGSTRIAGRRPFAPERHFSPGDFWTGQSTPIARDSRPTGGTPIPASMPSPLWN